MLSDTTDLGSTHRRRLVLVVAYAFHRVDGQYQVILLLLRYSPAPALERHWMLAEHFKGQQSNAVFKVCMLNPSLDRECKTVVKQASQLVIDEDNIVSNL